MNPAQRQLARHALGLPNARSLSYRNRYVVPEGTPAHGHWLMMVACGWAREVRAAHSAAGDAFCLTLEGAGLAVDPGEKLDPEDFVSIDGRAA